MTFVIKKGSLYYESNEINYIAEHWIKESGLQLQLLENRKKRDGDSYHITIIPSKEMTKDILSQIDLNNLNSIPINLYDFGVGKIELLDNMVFYVVVYSMVFDQIRTQFNLGPKDFHITLGFKLNDIHDRPKNFNTITNQINKYNLELLNKIVKADELLDKIYINHLLDNLQYDISDINNQLMGSTLFGVSKLYQNNLGIISKISAILIDLKFFVGVYFKMKIMERTDKDNINSFLEQSLLDQAFFELDNQPEYRYKLKTKINDIIENKIVENYYKYIKNNDNSYTLTKISMPRNFSWINQKLCASSIPEKEVYLEIIKDAGITTIVSLLEEDLPTELTAKFDFDYNYYYVIDRKCPSIDQMTEICSKIDNADICLIHCIGGRGRTAVVLICYLIWKYKIDKNNAMNYISNRNTILDNIQLDFINEWWQYTLKNTIPTVKFPPFIMMVGFPASGKSTFSTSIANSVSKILRVNQDEIREKGKCEELVGKYTKNNSNYTTVILDRCNLKKDERKYWLDLAYNKKAWCIFFDIDIDLCKYRITRRKNHPTVKEGSGINILESVKNNLEHPDMAEGFDKIFTISSQDESNNLLEKWGIPLPEVEDNSDHIIKFPRTRHLINLGSATRDDLVLDKDQMKKFLDNELIIEEKIDGANMGFSLTKDSKVKCQNRSHFVTSEYSNQFKILDKWISKNSADLFTVLEPERHILFGEWLYMKHSIGYDKLADYFIVFDIFDSFENKFFSRSRLEETLANTNFKIIPLIAKKKFSSMDELLKLVKSKSSFYDGPIEGIYIRINNEKWLVDRAKIVSDGFTNQLGDRHWSKNIITLNKLNIDK